MSHPDFEVCQNERTTCIEASQKLYMQAAIADKPHASSRLLLASEIDTLVSNRCRCKDWTKIRLVAGSTDQSEDLKDLVYDTSFQGIVVLILPTSDTDDDESWHCSLPAGIHSNLCIKNSVISLNARVHRNNYIADTFIGAFAAVINCGCVRWLPDTKLGIMTVTVGPEKGGGRDIVVSPETDLRQVVQQMTCSGQSAAQPSGMISMNIIDHHCLVRDTATIEAVYLHPKASIEAAMKVSKAILYPHSHITSSSTAEDVFLQWRASISDCSTVTETFLMEEAHAGPHSIVVSTILGPDVHVSAGEVHASVVGPNTNAHHQSILIGVLWPLGRGNVGYGANVGSNHTGRLPDQECVAGEGVFWGLSSVIKFPVDLSSAPYTIVAAGTAITPQRVTMPFSLIVANDKTGINDIIPGWLLRSSPYTLARSEVKYATRRKAIRHKSYTGWKIIRAETVALCWHARTVLRQASGLEHYDTDLAVPGIGSNRLSEKGRLNGIDSYTKCIQLYALQGLLQFIIASGGSLDDCNSLLATEMEAATQPELVKGGIEWNIFPWEISQDDWVYQRFLLKTEFPVEDGNMARWLEKCLRLLIELERDSCDRIYKSKSRDDDRGEKTIPGYKQSHEYAKEDPAIVAVKVACTKLEETVTQLLTDGKVQSSKL